MLQGLKIKLIIPIVILISVFVGGTLWRIDESLYKDRTQWLESQLRTQVLSLQQNFRADISFWQKIPIKDLKNWPQFLASAELGHFDESFVWNEAVLRAQKKDSFIKKIKSLSPTWADGASVSYSVFLDLEQKPRGVIWTKQDGKIYLIVFQPESWQSWLEAFRGPGAELFAMNTDGVSVAHVQRDYLGQKMVEHPVFTSLAQNKDLQQFVQIMKFPDRKIYSVVAEKVPGSNLILAATTPLSEVLVGRSSLRWQILVLAVGVLLLILAYIFFIDLRDPERERFVEFRAEAKLKAAANLAAQQVATTAEPKTEDKIKIYKSIASAVGHELRGPLSSILATVQALGASENQNEPMQKILRETREAKGILDKVLGFSGQTVHDKVEMKLETPIRKVLKKLEGFLKSKNITLVTEIEDDHLLPIDQEPLMKAFENLILNAVESMDRQLGKKITVTVKSYDKATVVMIEDQGQGMDPQTLEKAKDPFFTTRSFAHHLGLGLSEADGIFKEHNADMKLYSQVGKGTRIEIRFNHEQVEMSKPISSASLSESQPSLKIPMPPPVPTPEQIRESLVDTEESFVTSSLTQAPLEPADMSELLDLPPLPEKDLSEETSSSKGSVSAQEIKMRLENIEPPEETSPTAKNKKPVVDLPNFKIEKPGLVTDQFKVSVRRPGMRSP